MRVEKSDETRWPGATEWLVLAGAWSFGIGLRLLRVEQSFLFGDELHALWDVFEGYRHVLTHFGDTGSGLGLPLLQRLSIDAFGANHWSIRAPAYLPGIALLVLAWPLGCRIVGRRAALVACPLLATLPLLIFYSHFARAYAAVALLCLLLLDRVQRVVDEETRPGRRSLFTIALLLALLPWLHPTALAFSLPVTAAGIAALLLARRRRDAAGLLWALVAGGVLCLALHAPAWRSLVRFAQVKTTSQYFGDFGFMDVAALLAGGRALAWLTLPALAVSALSLWRTRRHAALPLLAGAAGPGAVIAAIGPYGDAYAYARYVLPASLAAGLLLAHGVARLIEGRCAQTRRAARCTAASALLLAGALWLAGPYGAGRVADGPYANGYSSMQPLPAFDRAWDAAPAFYDELTRRAQRAPDGLRIVEAPALTTRSRFLYRNAYLRHRAQTLLGLLPGEFPCLPDGPYTALGAPGWSARAHADLLLLHLDIARELTRYWRFVYGDAARGRASEALMQRHERLGGPLLRPSPALLSQLESDLGAPLYRDDELVVWSLPTAAAGSSSDSTISTSR